MWQEQTLYEYLYHSLATQLECGAFPPGQILPSQKQICEKYNVGITTVRKVMKMLDNNGYIRTAFGQPAVVTYESPAESCVSALVSRRAEISDAFQGLGELLPALYRKSAECSTDAEHCKMQRTINEIHDGMDLTELYRHINIFFITLVKSLDNSLAVDLEIDSENFLHVPYLSCTNAKNPFYRSALHVKMWLQKVLNLIIGKQYDTLYQSIRIIYTETGRQVDIYLASLEGHVHTDAPAKREIQWFRVKNRTELYASLAMTIMRRIIYGEFDGQKYLPSIPRLMEDYNVTKETASRAISLLSSLGITETLDKKGTVIVTGKPSKNSTRVDLKKPAIRQKLRLCIESLQIMALTVRNCTNTSGPIPADLADVIESRLSQVSSDRISPLSVQLLMSCSIQMTPCHSLRNIYRQLNELMSWGYYLESAEQSLYPAPDKISDAMKEFIAALKSRSQEYLPHALEKAFSQIYTDAISVFTQIK